MKDLCATRDVKRFEESINKEYGNQIFVGIVNEENMYELSKDLMIQEIERLLRNSFSDTQKNQKFKAAFSEDEDMTPMFNSNIQVFKKYLSDDLSPKVAELQKVFFKYQFDSPLDFIMIKSDFKRFFESFS